MEADLTTAARAQLVLDRCNELASHSDEPDRLTRPYGSESLRAAQDLVGSWMTVAGMEVRRDVVGNLIGRYESRPGSERALLLGSHLDTVRDAGKYDGPLGVLVAISAVERLRQRGRQLPCTVDVIGFADEEGLRFQSPYLGSRALAGSLGPDALEMRDSDGVTLRAAIVAFGGDPEEIPAAARESQDLLGYLEVHIEQGPRLEASDLPVGVVTAIAGQSRFSITFTGEAGHAGTVPMALRRDALTAAAEFTLEVEARARQVEGLVSTVGQIEVEPGASNVVPGRVRLCLDVRHADDTVRLRACDDLRGRADNIATDRHVHVEWQEVAANRAVLCDRTLSDHLAAAVAAGGTPLMQLVSGAGHDAVVLSDVCPVAMLFVRCEGGVSHNPGEAVRQDDVGVALEVLDRFLESFPVEDMLK